MINEIKGQMNIFQYLETLKTSSPVLRIGQEVYKVTLRNIDKFFVKNSYLIREDNERQYGYALENKDSKASTYDLEIGKSVFTSLAEAEKNVAENKDRYEMLSAEDMHVVSKKVFSYTRACDKRQMYLFYAVLDNGYIYAKDYHTYHYITDCSEKKALKHLMEQVESIGICKEETELPGPLRNMYKCNEHPSWLYTEAECSHVRGYVYNYN